MLSSKVKSLVEKLQLEPHPEGGFYRETYRSERKVPKQILRGDFSGDRNLCTAIYYLLTSDNFSAFHRIKQDELWHFYAGAPLQVHVIDPIGKHKKFTIGTDVENDQFPQLLVPAGCWFASNVAIANNFSLVGCTVAPGFDFADFELAKRGDLIAKYPEWSEVIFQFTRF